MTEFAETRFLQETWFLLGDVKIEREGHPCPLRFFKCVYDAHGLCYNRLSDERRYPSH